MNRSHDSEGNPFDCMLRFDYMTHGALHDVQLEHKAGQWRLLSDGKVVAVKTHNKVNPLTPASHRLEFHINAGDLGLLQAALKTAWNVLGGRWSYRLSINGVNVKPAWARDIGDLGLCCIRVRTALLGNPNPQTPVDVLANPALNPAPGILAVPASAPMQNEMSEAREASPTPAPVAKPRAAPMSTEVADQKVSLEACANGCDRPCFKQFSTCCTHCKGAHGPHAADCEAKAHSASMENHLSARPEISDCMDQLQQDGDPIPGTGASI